MYQGLYGSASGEDVMCRQWADLLAQQCELELWTVDLAKRSDNPIDRATKGIQSIWNFRALKTLEDKLDLFQPDIVIFGNFQGLSAAALHVVEKRNIKSVTLVHNFRPICGSGVLFREGNDCTLCPAKDWSAAIWTSCIGGNMRNSIAPAIATRVHRVSRSFERSTVIVSPSSYVANTLKDFGIVDAPYLVMPNWAPAPPAGSCVDFAVRKDFLFAGHLHEYKGINRLAEAWRSSDLSKQHKLFIAGEGPLTRALEAISREDNSIVVLGTLAHDQLRRLMGSCLAMVIPSSWQEPFGLVAIEAMSVGTPIITTKNGALVEINTNGVGELVSEVTANSLDTTSQKILADWNAYSTRALSRFQTIYSVEAANARLAELLDFLYNNSETTMSADWNPPK